MIRTIRLGALALSFAVAAAFIGAPLAPAHAQEGKGKTEAKSKARAQAEKGQTEKGKGKASDKGKGKGKGEDKADSKPSAGKGSAKGAKPVPVTTSGDWGVFTTQGGKSKTCYVLAKPSARAPAALKRDPAYVFISTRPAENVRNEVSIIMGFAMKAGGDARADIGGVTFELAPQGSNAWLKNLAEQDRFLDALRKGSKMTVRAASAKGNVTTDTYSLSGLSGALDRLQKECP